MWAGTRSYGEVGPGWYTQSEDGIGGVHYFIDLQSVSFKTRMQALEFEDATMRQGVGELAGLKKGGKIGNMKIVPHAKQAASPAMLREEVNTAIVVLEDLISCSNDGAAEQGNQSSVPEKAFDAFKKHDWRQQECYEETHLE